jgi:hypothetical protein
MPKKATASEAQVILELYSLRREPELRKARDWCLTKFWPASADDYIKIGMALGSQENAWLRQVGSYWGMAALLALHGAINPELFLQPALSGEMIFLFAKVQPFLKELREKLGDPQAFAAIEKVIAGSKFGRERLALTRKRVETMREKLANKAA